MTPFFSRGMSGIAQCCAILALTNRKPIEEKEKPMKRYIVERTVNDEPTGINWEFDTREEALAFFKQAAEDLPREWKTEKQSSSLLSPTPGLTSCQPAPMGTQTIGRRGTRLKLQSGDRAITKSNATSPALTIRSGWTTQARQSRMPREKR